VVPALLKQRLDVPRPDALLPEGDALAVGARVVPGCLRFSCVRSCEMCVSGFKKIEMMLSSLLRPSSCRALTGACSGAAALACTRAGVLGRRHYLAPSLLAGLGAYGENFGHVRVPQKFVVPDADGWPEEARGLKLGMQVNVLRQQKKRDTLPQDDVAQLEALGFVWNLFDWKWQCVLQSLQAYQEAHGDLEVPQPFVVPSEAPWPEDAWGLKLGSRVDNIRRRGDFVRENPERRAELDGLGFAW